MDIPRYESLQKQARKARREAEEAATQELLDWYNAETAALEADTSLSAHQRDCRELDLLLECGRRSNRALAKAKRDNSVPKLLERQARADVEPERESQR